MSVIFVARSARLLEWASDVGLGKHVYKVGVAADAAAAKAAAARGWAGETDWTLVKRQDAVDVTEAEVLDRLAKKAKVVDPTYYPRIRGEPGLFKILPTQVENHILVAKAVAGEAFSRDTLRLKATDFAAYLISNALKQDN